VHYPELWAAVEIRVQVSRTRFRVPDVTIVAGRKPSSRIVITPPHVAVEVLSPEDRATYVQKKIDDYLAFGIPYVWIIDPESRNAWIHTKQGSYPVRDGFLRAENPEIAVPLAELFA